MMQKRKNQPATTLGGPPAKTYSGPAHRESLAGGAST